MKLTNSILHQLNKTAIGRELLGVLISSRYRHRGKKIESVKYLDKFNVWEIVIDRVAYLSSGPGWAYDFEFLLNQLKSLSCNKYLPKYGDIVFDIGAGVGEETIILSRLVGASGKIFAVEAHPKTFGALNYMVQKNQLDNVSCINTALSDNTGIVEIDDSVNSLANTILSTGKLKAFKVQAQTLDDLVMENKLSRIDLVKMNVEGAEQLIIKGMHKSLPIIRNIAISCHDFLFEKGESEFFRTKQTVTAFLKDNGFVVTTQQATDAMVEDYVYGVNSYSGPADK